MGKTTMLGNLFKNVSRKLVTKKIFFDKISEKILFLMSYIYHSHGPILKFFFTKPRNFQVLLLIGQALETYCKEIVFVGHLWLTWSSTKLHMSGIYVWQGSCRTTFSHIHMTDTILCNILFTSKNWFRIFWASILFEKNIRKQD